MTALAVAAGVLLGVLSRIEEVTPGLSAGISSDSAWVLTAFAAGALAPSVRQAVPAATVAMCAANGGYYAWIALTEPGTPLESAAGDPWRWVAAGVLTGVVFGAAGRLWRAWPPPRRLAAAAPPAIVLAIEGGDALRGGAATDGIGLALGIVLAATSARDRPRAALGAAAGLAALAASGAGAALLP